MRCVRSVANIAYRLYNIKTKKCVQRASEHTFLIICRLIMVEAVRLVGVGLVDLVGVGLVLVVRHEDGDYPD